jgi:hypothetical protein
MTLLRVVRVGWNDASIVSAQPNETGLNKATMADQTACLIGHSHQEPSAGLFRLKITLSSGQNPFRGPHLPGSPLPMHEVIGSTEPSATLPVDPSSRESAHGQANASA